MYVCLYASYMHHACLSGGGIFVYTHMRVYVCLSL